MSNKRKKKSARKQAAKIPAWFFARRAVPVHLKRDVEDALARHAADSGIAVASAKFRALTLQSICPSLRLVNAARWSAVRPEMIHTAKQPTMKVLATHLQDFKKKRKQIEQMVAELAAADDGSQSSPGSAEEGEEEEAQADDSATSRGHDNVMDGEKAGPKPAYAEGNPRELLQPAEGEEGAAADQSTLREHDKVMSAKTPPLVQEIMGRISEAIDAQQGAAEHERLRITFEEASRWG